jgi:hypothetical protein
MVLPPKISECSTFLEYAMTWAVFFMRWKYIFVCFCLLSIVVSVRIQDVAVPPIVIVAEGIAGLFSMWIVSSLTLAFACVQATFTVKEASEVVPKSQSHLLALIPLFGFVFYAVISGNDIPVTAILHISASGSLLTMREIGRPRDSLFGLFKCDFEWHENRYFFPSLVAANDASNAKLKQLALRVLELS